MANETEAPTSGVTKSAADMAIEKGENLSLEQLDFVTLVAQHYRRYGSLLTAELANEKYDLPIDDYNRWIKKDKVRQAIKDFDVDLERYERVLNSTEMNAWQANALTPQQLIVADTMTDLTDQRSDKKKLQDLRVTTRQWQAWLRDPVFREYVDSKVENILQHDGVHVAGLALMDRVSAGDTKAIQFYYEYIGKFTPKAAGGADQYNQINFQQIVARMLEIIVEETDGETSFRIGERFKLLMAANNLAAEMLAEEENQVRIPEVAPARELSERMQKVMDLAGGDT